jgi:hypothetical protein
MESSSVVLARVVGAFIGATGLALVITVITVKFEMAQVPKIGMYGVFGLLMYVHFVLTYGHPVLFAIAVGIGLFYAGGRLAAAAGYETPSISEVSWSSHTTQEDSEERSQ